MRDGRAHCAYRERDTMGENDQNTAIDPRTCPLSAFEGKTWDKIPRIGQGRIIAAYESFFDGLDARKRAIGYCVLNGGIAPRKIGTLDAVLGRSAQGFRVWTLAIDGHMCVVPPLQGLIDALNGYMYHDPRLCELWESVQPNGYTTAPLFVPTRNGKHERLANVLTFMWNAAKAVGFDARHVCLNRIATPIPIHPTPWEVSAVCSPLLDLLYNARPETVNAIWNTFPPPPVQGALVAGASFFYHA